MRNVLTDPPGAAYSMDADRTLESSASALSWAAIIGGAVAAVCVTLVLLLLGAGLGFASISPWPNAGATAAGFTITAGIWLIVVQWLSSGMGGYITGRLRTKWVNTHTHEVFFRDTAHGFLSWALATLIGAIVIGSVLSSVAGTATRAAATVVSGVAQGAAGMAQGVAAAAPAVMGQDYGVDSLFRGAKAELAATAPETRRETARILANALTTGEMPEADKTYLTDMVATRTGVAPADARKRVDDLIAREKALEVKARQAADAARKTAATVSIFTALSMMIGALIASAAAAYGGGARDEAV